MSLPSSTALQVMFAVAIVIFTAYAAGRVHQWYRHGFEREEAFREGYNQASHALFHLATRNIAGKAGSADGHADGPRARHGREVEPTRLDTAGAA
jgi:hypothetical protein